VAAPAGHVALAVVVRGIEAPCDVTKVTEVLEWVVPLFGDSPGVGQVELRCTCPDVPDEVAAVVAALRAGQGARGFVPGRRGRTVRLDLADADARKAFCVLAPWSTDARIVRKRKHLLAIADGSRSFWVELPDAEAEDLRVWFRRRGVGKLIDMDTWEPAEPVVPQTRKGRRRR
jgi:hypothetical protein